MKRTPLAALALLGLLSGCAPTPCTFADEPLGTLTDWEDAWLEAGGAPESPPRPLTRSSCLEAWAPGSHSSSTGTPRRHRSPPLGTTPGPAAASMTAAGPCLPGGDSSRILALSPRTQPLWT